MNEVRSFDPSTDPKAPGAPGAINYDALLAQQNGTSGASIEAALSDESGSSLEGAATDFHEGIRGAITDRLPRVPGSRVDVTVEREKEIREATAALLGTLEKEDPEKRKRN